MPNLNDYEDSDELYNPVTHSIAKKEQDAVKNNGSNTLNSTSSGKSATNSSASQGVQEQEASQGFYEPDDNKPDRGASRTVSLRTILKKRGPLAALMALGLGLPTLLAVVLSPALALQQFAEMLTGEFNDQLGALDVRSTYLLKKKYHSTLTKGSCGTVTIRCKYRTIRENSGLAKRLNNAGVTIEGDKSIVPGRVKPTHFVFEGKRIPAKDLVKEASRNVSLQKALRKGYDPLYAAFSDRKAADIRTRLGLKRSSDVKASSDKEKMEEDLKKTAAGENNIPADGQKLTEVKDDEGKVTGYTDTDGNSYTPDEGKRLNNLIDESLGRGKLAEKVGKTATKASLKGVLTSTAFGAGAIDSACTAWTLIRVAGFAAKYYQQRQLIRYGYEFVKVAHKQKYGDLTAEEADYWFGKLTKTNSEGKGALDSDGYRFAAYGDTFNPGSFDAETANLKKGEVSDEDVDKIMVQNETSRYINGQLVSTSLMAKIAGAVTQNGSAGVDAADGVCKFTKSWKGQALVFGLAAAGAIVAFFTGGASISVGAIAQGAVSVAISVAFALLQPKLIDMAKGEVIKGDENGNEVGNAVTSGIGGYNAQTAPGRGLGVATKDTYQAYSQLNTKVAAKYAEYDREERSPLDPTSKNTFLGSIMANLTPYITKSQNVGTAGLSIFSFVTSNITSFGMGKTAHAADDIEKYSQCNDPEYTDRNLAADPFCNLRYAIPVGELSIDPEAVLDYMVNNGYVTEEDATPQGEYADYVAKCFNRQTSIGDKFTDYTDGESEGNGDAGDECIVGNGGENEDKYKMFRLFYLDTSVDDGMDEDFDTANPQTTGGVDLKIASFNVRGASHDGENGTTSHVTRMKRTVQVVKDEQFDVVGFQEFENSQRDIFVNELGGTYSLSSKDAKDDNGNGIAWNTAKFDLISKGTQPNLKYTTGNTLKSPWVKLKDKTTQQVFYFMNTHDPANVHDHPVTKNAARRTDNAKEHVKFMEEKAAEGVPVLMSGDFNSGFKPKDGDINVTNQNMATTLPYCIMTGSGTIKNAFDMYKGRQVKCPNESINWDKEDPGKNCSTQIDHLYILPGSQPAEVSEFGCVRKGDDANTVETGNGSDHDTVKFTVSLGSSAQNSGAGTDFIIGSYNQKRSLSLEKHNAAAQNIVDKKMDIVGTQETSNPKFSHYKSFLSGKGYGVYPTYAGPNQTCVNAEAIFYNKSKFKLLKSEYFEIPRYPDAAVNCGNGEKTTASHNEDGLSPVWSHMPIVWLQDVNTSQTVIVLNIHNEANVPIAKGTQPAKSRWRSGQIFMDQIRRLKSQNPGIPIIMTGDFNEGTDVRTDGNVTWQGDRNNLFFCMITSSGLMRSAAGPDKCVAKNSIGGVDYIYITPEVQVQSTDEIANGGGDSGPPSYTDHPVRYAHLVIPGSGSGTHPNTGSNIDGDDYKGECNKYLGSGDCTGECAGFVKFRLVKHGVIKLSDLPNGKIGNGGQVTTTLRGLGFKVDTTPAVNSTMSLKRGTYGHTAMVSQVNKDGSIIVEEYNWDVDHGYGKRKISAATLNAQRQAGTLSFAHTEVKYK